VHLRYSSIQLKAFGLHALVPLQQVIPAGSPHEGGKVDAEGRVDQEHACQELHATQQQQEEGITKRLSDKVYETTAANAGAQHVM
jgi:hypothetical protein